MLYPVNEQLVADLFPQNRKRLRANVLEISQPLSEFSLCCTESLPVDASLAFRLSVGLVPLVQGSATVRYSAAVSGQYQLGVRVEAITPDVPWQVAQRLSPFVLPEMRASYVEALSTNVTQQGESALMPWIESSYRLSLLLDLIARINSKMEVNALLAAIMSAAKIIMEAEASSLLLLDRDSGELIVAVPTGPASSEISGKRIPRGAGFGGWVVEHREAIAVQDAHNDPRFYGEISASGFHTKSLVCVPMHGSDGKILGALQAINKIDGTLFGDSDIPLFSVLADQAAIAIEKAQLHQEALEKQALEQQLRLAYEIQKGFWPKVLPQFPGVAMAGMNMPATHVGGDYYDFIPMDDHRCAIAVGDVCGKGVAAALLMASLRAALRALVENDYPVEETIFLVNNILYKDTPPDQFVTLFYGIIDTAKSEFTYVNGGHNPAFLWDRNTNEMRQLQEGGTIVGILENTRYETATEKLGPGHVLVLYTDGVTEAQNARGEFFDEARLAAQIRQHAHHAPQVMMDKIFRAVEEFCEETPQTDDITLVVIKIDVVK